MTMTMIMMIIIVTIKRFPAHDDDELGTCGTSLASPKQSVLRISIRSTSQQLLLFFLFRPWDFENQA